MTFNWDIRSVILTIAAFQAVIVSVLLLVRSFKKDSQSDRLLAFFLLAMTAVLSEHIAGWLNLYVGQGLTYFPFGATFVFAPLAYLYIKSITNSQYKWSEKEGLHFIPAIIYFLVHFFVWFHPLQQKQHLIDVLFRYKWNDGEGYGSAIIFTIYLYKIIKHYNAYLKWLPDEFSNTEKLKLNWVRNFIFLLGVYYFVFLGFGIASLVNWYGYKTQFWLYLMLAITIYYISASGYAYVNKLKVAFDSKKANPEQEVVAKNISPINVYEKSLLNSASDTKVNEQSANNVVAEVDNSVSNSANQTASVKYDAASIKQLLIAHLQNKKPFLDSDLTLSQLSNKLEKPAYIITQVIKNNLGTNFNDLINGYRVNSVIEKIKQGEHKTQTLLGIAYDCGFNSKATFNRAFKKAKNMAPSDFVEKL
jgi:AraC-like DNA-binding protein